MSPRWSSASPWSSPRCRRPRRRRGCSRSPARRRTRCCGSSSRPRRTPSRPTRSPTRGAGRPSTSPAIPSSSSRRAMHLARLTELARPPGPGEADAPWFRLDREDDLAGLLAWFGEQPSQEGVKLTIAGEDVGYVARTDLYADLAGKKLGFGDALRWNLPGTPTSWEPQRLRCPVDGCGPHYVVRFDPTKPPDCPRHHRPLSPAG